MKTFDLYEFVGLIVPGTFLLLAYGVLFGEGVQGAVIPTNLGGLGVYVIVAYGLGHLVQAIGYGLEWLYWKPWRGKPTEWPITRPSWEGAPRALELISRATGVVADKETDAALWRSLVGEVRSALYSTGRATRLQVFNANYGLFRGVLAAVVVVALVAWTSDAVGAARAYAAVAAIGLLAERRMHRFSVHYAQELFSSAAMLAPKSGTPGEQAASGRPDSPEIR